MIKSDRDTGTIIYLIGWFRDLSCVSEELHDKTKTKAIKRSDLYLKKITDPRIKTQRIGKISKRMFLFLFLF